MIYFPKYLFSRIIGRISEVLKNEFELTMVNELSVFESLRFDCSIEDVKEVPRSQKIAYK